MSAPNVNELNLDEMLIKAETITGVLQVVHAIQNMTDYTREDAAKDLMDFLDHMGYLYDPIEVRKIGGILSEK